MATDGQMDDTRKVAKKMTDALNATDNDGSAGRLADAQVDARAAAHVERLATRTTALMAAANLTAGMSADEVQVDHDSREHDPDNPVTNVIALAGEFETWLQRDHEDETPSPATPSPAPEES